MRYYYECDDCMKQALSTYSNLVGDNGELPDHILDEHVLYETIHSMEPTDEELYNACCCPRCGSHNATRAHYRENLNCYIRGNGFLDRKGALRDMNKYKLLTDDPYAQYRMPGEVDEIANRLDKQGKHDPNTKYFV